MIKNIVILGLSVALLGSVLYGAKMHDGKVEIERKMVKEEFADLLAILAAITNS